MNDTYNPLFAEKSSIEPYSLPELEDRLFWLGVDGSNVAFEMSRRLWNGASDEEIAEAQKWLRETEANDH